LKTTSTKESKLRKLGVSANLERQILEFALPSIILPLVRRHIIREEHLSQPKILLQLLRKNVKKATKHMQWGISVEEEFLEEATTFWRRGEKMIGIVLYATAVEQYINYIYRCLFSAQGLEDEDITKMIRSLSIESKMTWLLPIAARKRFPQQLVQRLRAVFEIRNAIVHFKAEQAHPDSDEDSYSKIEKQLESLKRLSPKRDFDLLGRFLWSIVLEKDASMALTIKIAESIKALEKKIMPI
jgi:hypothetical protein